MHTYVITLVVKDKKDINQVVSKITDATWAVSVKNHGEMIGNKAFINLPVNNL